MKSILLDRYLSADYWTAAFEAQGWDRDDVCEYIRKFVAMLEDGALFRLKYAGGWDFAGTTLQVDVLQCSAFFADLNGNASGGLFGALPPPPTDYKCLVNSVDHFGPRRRMAGSCPEEPRTHTVKPRWGGNNAYLDYGSPGSLYGGGDGIVSTASQNLANVTNRSVAVIQRVENHMDEATDHVGILKGLGYPVLSIIAQSPVDLMVTGPSGQFITLTDSAMFLATYREVEYTGLDTPHDIVEIPFPEEGEYAIEVIPHEDALSTDTYSLTITRNEEVSVLAQDVQVGDIPATPYAIVGNTIPIANAGPEQRVVQDGSGQAEVTLSGSQSSDPDGDELRYEWTLNGAIVSTVAAPVLSLPLGTHTITLVASDGVLDSAPDDVIVTVCEAVAITCPADAQLDCPADTSVEANGSAAAVGCGVAVMLSDSVVSECGATQTITRTWTATDEFSNTAACNQILQVVDTSSPTLTCPSDFTMQCEAPDGSAVIFTTNSEDACDVDPIESCVDQNGLPVTSGDIFPIGTTDVSCTAEDACANSSVPCSFAVTIESTPPTISDLDASWLLAPIGTAVVFEASFTDNSEDVHTADWNFGDGANAGPASATSPASASHSYASPGIFSATATITDRCGNTATESLVVVIYDPAAGFTTGGGWFVPDAESFVDGINVTDTVSKANFGFVVKYRQGASNPDGHLEFRYKAGDIDLKSAGMDWMVVQSATKVRFKGLATINGEGPYTFKVTAEDNGEPGTNDTFQIEIWLGVTDTENSPPTPKHKAKGNLGGGNIKIHDR